MIDAEALIELQPLARKTVIYTEVSKLQESINAGEYEAARNVSAVINTFIDDYFEIVVARDKESLQGSILSSERFGEAVAQLISEFKPTAIASLQKAIPSRSELIAHPKNLYELSGAVKLSLANRITRNLSTTMGNLWERIANISPYALNPEIEFALKIVGIDLIARNVQTKDIEYQQLKTLKNTLTGSQQHRSQTELGIHQNPVFCASFSTKSNWTFHSPKIPRVDGAAFWGRIGMDYDVVLEQTKQFILELEAEYVTILQSASS